MDDNRDFFGEEVAARYDESVAEMFDPDVVEPAVTLLEELAEGGPVLELGIGTGRLAIPLMERGLRVQGIDLSTAMVARLREKPLGTDIPVAIGDFATTELNERFSLVYLVFNTIMNLTTQAQQVACFRNVARHLQPGGCFLIETGMPDLQRLPPGETFRPFRVTGDRLGFDEYDVTNQGLISHHLRVVDDRVERLSIPFRYVWPAELDLMAELAGMRPRSRWSGWQKEPFSHEKGHLVGVWELPA